MRFNKLNRSIHKWGSIVIAIPFLIILVTGILLLIKKEVSYIQPITIKGSAKIPSVSFEEILQAAKTVKHLNITGWESIDRLDVRPKKGLIKLQTHTHWEIQIDSATADILHVAYRRSDIIEKIHDGTYWQKKANWWLTLPIAIALLVISITGIFLFALPYIKRYKNKQKHQ